MTLFRILVRSDHRLVAWVAKIGESTQIQNIRTSSATGPEAKFSRITNKGFCRSPIRHLRLAFEPVRGVSGKDRLRQHDQSTEDTMVKAILSFAIAFLAVMTVVTSAAETENENSTISTALLNTDEAIETEAMPEDEPKTTRNVGCKKFFPSIGRSLTVPCGVEASAPSLSTSMRQDKSLWATIKDSDKVSDFEFYLSRFPKGRYSAVAELKIEQLKVAHARAVAAKTPPPSITEDSPSIKTILLSILEA